MRKSTLPIELPAGTFEALGVDADEESVYRVLLNREGASANEIARARKMPVAKAQRVLTSLELKGLVTRSPERVPRFLPAPPDLAIDALASKRESELKQVRLVGSRLRDELTRTREQAPKSAQRIVELITGSAAQVRVYEQLQQSAREEFLGIERPPYVMGVANRNVAQGRAIARGVAYRNIVDASTLELPGALERLREHMDAGENTRVFPGVSLKLVVVDRSIALIPLTLDRVHEVALLVRSSTLLDALCQLFELMWAQSTPITFDGAASPAQTHGAGALPSGTEHLLTLLAAGVNDKAIMHALGVSARTLDRRIMQLMKSLDARNRFHAGWLAALKMAPR